MNTTRSRFHASRQRLLAFVGVVAVAAALLTPFTLAPAPAVAAENWQSGPQTYTTTNQTTTQIGGAGGQHGAVVTRHWARTNVTYPKNVRAGETFTYTRCVSAIYLEESSGYEASIDAFVFDGTRYGFDQIWTQDYYARDVSACKDYTATAPTAGSTQMTIPSRSIGFWGGVGFAGSCCPRWSVYWAVDTTDNTLYFDNVYTATVARDDGVFAVARGSQLTVSPLANDDGFQGGLGSKVGTPTAHAITAQGTLGTCAWVGNQIRYTNNGTAGMDSCRYQLRQAETDNGGTSGQVTAVVRFRVNEPPTAVDDVGETDELSAIDVDVLANDSDLDGDTISVSAAAVSAGGGSASVVDGKVRFDPEDDFIHLAPGAQRIATVNYTLVDVGGLESVGTLIVTVSGLYTVPVAKDDAVSLGEDDADILIDPRLNDVSDDGAVLVVRSIDTTGLIGTARIEGGAIVFEPGALFQYLAEEESGTTSLSYVVSDSISPEDTTFAMVTITVVGANDAPLAEDDTAVVDEDASVTIDAAANDHDVDLSDTLSAVDAWVVSGGGLVTVAGGKVVFATDTSHDDLAVGQTRVVTLGYTVSDPFGATSDAEISITVTGVNDAPVAADTSLIVSEDGPAGTLDVIAGDQPASDPDTDDTLTVASVAPPARGQASFSGSEVTFDPAGDFEFLALGESTTETFSYTITDGNGGSASANVTVTVQGRNDAPIAVTDVIDVNEDGGAVSLDLLENDADVDNGSSFSFVSMEFGQFAEFAAVPTVSGSTVSIDPDGMFETLSLGETAVLEGSYVIEDEHGAQSTGVFRIVVHGENDAPTGGSIEWEIDEDTVVTDGSLAELAADIDRADTLSVTAVEDTATAGAVSLVGGVVRYDPRAAFDQLDVGESANDSFTAIVSDGHGGSARVLVTIVVSGVDDPPLLAADTRNTNEDTVIVVDVLSNDVDPEGDTLVLRSFDASMAQSEVTLVGGQLRVDPRSALNHLAVGDTVTDTIEYTAEDEGGLRSTSTLTVTIAGVNDAPDGAEVTVTVTERAVGVFDLGTMGLDPDDGASVTIAGVLTAPAKGEVSMMGNVLTFDPGEEFVALAAGEHESVSLQLGVEDEHGATGVATVLVKVTGLNDVPIAQDDSLTSVDVRNPVIDVLANDSDVDASDVLRVLSVRGGAIGQFSIVDGGVKWDIGAAYAALSMGAVLSTSFGYTVSDGQGGEASATATIEVSRTIPNDQDADGNGIPDWFENGQPGDSVVLPGALQSCPAPNGLLDVRAGLFRPGGSIEVSGSLPWLAHSRIAYYLCSTPTLLGNASAAVDGRALTTLKVPANTVPGTHTVVGIGLSPEGDVLVQSYAIDVVPRSGDLATTGGTRDDSAILFALLVLLLGAGALLRHQRRRIA